jgi:hypothetical protein
LKHLALFSGDSIEKGGFAPEKDENQGLSNVTSLYIPSIENV